MSTLILLIGLALIVYGGSLIATKTLKKTSPKPFDWESQKEYVERTNKILIQSMDRVVRGLFFVLYGNMCALYIYILDEWEGTLETILFYMVLFAIGYSVASILWLQRLIRKVRKNELY